MDTINSKGYLGEEQVEYSYEPDEQAEKKKTKVIAVISQKGGVAKTTSALSLSHVLSNKGDKVLLIDIDPQSSASQLLNITPVTKDKTLPTDDLKKALDRLEKEDCSYVIDELDDPFRINKSGKSFGVQGVHTLLDILAEGYPLSREIADPCIHKPTYKLNELVKNDKNETLKDKTGKALREAKYYYHGFDLLPSTEELSDVQLNWALSKMSKDDKGKQLTYLVDFLTNEYDYDWIIFDCPPSVDLLSINAMYAATSGILISTTPDDQSSYAIERIKSNIAQIKFFNFKSHNGCLGILMNIFSPQRQVDRFMAKTIGKTYCLKLFDTKILATSDAPKASVSGLLLTELNRRSYEQFNLLVDEIVDRIEYLDERRTYINDRLIDKISEVKSKINQKETENLSKVEQTAYYYTIAVQEIVREHEKDIKKQKKIEKLFENQEQVINEEEKVNG